MSPEKPMKGSVEQIMIRVAIVEDEEHSASVLKKYIEKYGEETAQTFSCVCFKDGLDFISDYQPVYDIVFMDIRMSHLDGIEASRKLREYDQDVALIFVTNMMQYAIKGYEVNALDFMVKPVVYYDFRLKFNKAIEYAKKHQNRSLTIDLGEVKIRIALTGIYYIEVYNHTLIYHTENGRYESAGQLTRMESALQDNYFAKCNNSYLINLRHVMEIHPDTIVVNKDHIPLSRRKKRDFMKHLTNYMGGGV